MSIAFWTTGKGRSIEFFVDMPTGHTAIDRWTVGSTTAKDDEVIYRRKDEECDGREDEGQDDPMEWFNGH